MKHHRHNTCFPFTQAPVEFTKHTEKALLQYCLGGVLYMPGTKNVFDKVVSGKPPAPVFVMCLEDAIREEDLGAAEANILDHLRRLAASVAGGRLAPENVPLVFIRVRNPGHFRTFVDSLDSSCHLGVLAGFVFPKFDSSNGEDYLGCLEEVCNRTGEVLYGMPILEGRTIALTETRQDELSSIRILLARHRERILNIRVGATDFSSIFGVRRGINYSIYDIMTVRDCLADILNCFTRESEDYVVSAPVWEYFLANKEDNLEHLVKEDIHRSLLQRNSIINDAIDGLLREVILDKANGFVGKTMIHPSHLKYVNAMQAVTREEFEDAMQVLETSGGVVKSARENKMNEVNPHRNWANRTVQRASAYGVIEDESSYLRLILGGM